MLRMGDAAVAVRSLPFRIGGEDADMVWGGMCCSIRLTGEGRVMGGWGYPLLSVSGVGAVVNGHAMVNEGEPWVLFNGDVLAMAGLQFVVEDIRKEASAYALPPPSEREVTGSGKAGACQALERAMEKALECIICHETVLPAPSEPRPSRVWRVRACASEWGEMRLRVWCAGAD